MKSKPLCIFDFDHYKDFIAHHFTTNSGLSGMKTSLARAINCQPPYLSKVLNGSAHLSLEQANAASVFWGLNEQESLYFLLLVIKDRSATKQLTKQIQNQLDKILEKELRISNRIETKKTSMSAEDKATYYSLWYFAAIHMATAVPTLNNAVKISQRLQLPLNIVNEALGFLLSCNLIKFEKGKYMICESSVHLPHNSNLVNRHHLNWRVRALSNMEAAKENQMHYSSVVAMSSEDIKNLRRIFLEAIERARTVIRDSEEQDIVCYSVDIFNV